MIKKFNIKFFFFFTNLLCSTSFVFAMENKEEYEGWEWTSTLNVQFPNKEIVDLKPVHLKMKEIATKNDSINRQAKRKEGKNGKNVVLLELGFVVKKEVAYRYESTDCFKQMVFFSGSDIKEEFKKVGKENYYEVNPVGYSFKPIDIQRELGLRFSPEDIKKSSISSTIYQKHSFQEFLNPKLLSETFSRELVKETEVPKLTSLNNIIDRFQNDIFYIHDRHAHSEPKVLFFLENTISALPSYWNFQFETALNDTIQKVKDFVLINHTIFSDKNVIFTLDNIQEEVINISVRNDISNKIKDTKKYIFLSQQEKIEEKIENTRLNGVDKVKKLREIFSNLKHLEMQNPLKLKLSDPGFFKTKAANALEILENLLNKKYYTRLKDIEEDDEKLTELESLLPYQDEERTTEQNWISGLIKSLSSFTDNEEITEVVLNLHSYNDVCESCGPSITRECERQDGFVARLKSIVMARNPPKSPIPYLRFLTSCSKIREGCEDRFNSKIFNPEIVKSLFTQTFLN